MYSVEEVANKLGVTKSIVYGKLKNKKLKDLIIKEKRRILISQELYSHLEASIKKKVNILENKPKEESIKEITEIKEPIKINNEKEEKTIDNDTIRISKKIVDALLDQIDKKDRQIEVLNTAIELNKANLSDNKSTKINYQKLEEHFNEVDKKLIDIRNRMFDKDNVEIETNTEKKSRRRFFFFGKPVLTN